MASIKAKTKENPKLMQKTLADGRQSLYLEYYMGYNKVFDEKTGKEHIKHIRSKEYLGLYLLPNPRTPEERQKNKETLALAAEIRMDKEKVRIAQTRILQYDVLFDSLFDHLFESLEITPRTLAFGMLLEIVDKLTYHFLGHLIRLDIGLHIGIGFGKKIAEPLQGALHHADVLFRIGVDIGLEKDEEIDFLFDRNGLVVFPGD